MKIFIHQVGFILSIELRKLLYHQICDEFETSYHEIEENLSKYVDILKKIKERGDWTVAMSVQGEDVEDRSLLSLELLEKTNVLNGNIKFTKRNIYKVFTLSKSGEELIKKITSK